MMTCQLGLGGIQGQEETIMNVLEFKNIGKKLAPEDSMSKEKTLPITRDQRADSYDDVFRKNQETKHDSYFRLRGDALTSIGSLHHQ
jgi:hypothetical protein